MNSLSIKAILLGILALIGLAAIAQNVTGVLALRESAAETSLLASTELPKIKALGEIKFLATRYRLNGSRLILEKDAAKVQSIETLNSTLIKKLSEASDIYLRLTDSPGELDMFAKFKDGWQRYKGHQDRSLEFARRGSVDEAAAYFGSDAFEAFNGVVSALDGIIAINQEQADSGLAGVSSATGKAFAISLGGLALMVLLLGSAAIVTLRRVSRPVEDITASMQGLANGDLATLVPHSERRDEIGAMASAVQVFKENALRVRALEDEEKRANVERMQRAQMMVDVVGEVSEVVRRAAEGDFSARLQVATDDPQMKQLVTGINEINRVVDEATGEFAEALGRVAQGDLTQSIQTAYSGRFGELKDALNTTLERLSETVSTIQTTSVEVGTAATEINSGANDLSSRTEQQASSLEETAATAEELAASVKAAAQSSRQAVEIANQAMSVATDGGKVVREAVEAMSRIEQASRKISDITGVIDEIAFQTNLLALNAAVEAARAGDAGKGFAVVASEVRTLAQRSSEAAKDITGLINASGQEVGHGVELVRGAGEALEKIVAASRKVSETVSDISTATGEQANGIEELTQAVAHMDEMTQQNAALAEESAASASALSEQIKRLNELALTFRTRAGGALSRSRTPTPAHPAAPDATRNEPDRLRQLAAEAFADGQSRSVRKPLPKPAARKSASRGTVGGWDEF